MPSGYICSNCGAPVSPAQNRCHQCGAEIDWEKAVGRTSYIDYLPDARKRRRKRRRVLLTGLLFLLALAALAWWGWNTGWMQTSHQSWQNSDLYRSVSFWEKQTPAPPLTPAPSPTPTSLPALQPAITPTSSPAPTQNVTPTRPPAPDPVQALVETARNLSQQDPCQAAELLQQALDIADTPDIESLRQESLARCRQQSSPLPTPPPSQRIAYTAYDIPSGLYSIRTWNLDDQQPGSKLMDWAMQPAFGPGGDLIYRSIQPDSPGVTLRQPDGVTRQITLGPDDSWPRWGPGGQQIIFTSAQRSADGSPHLYLVDTATQAVEELGPGRHADWSRTGQIIFSGCDAGGQNCGLWRLNPTTLQRTQVTTAPDDSNPVWSPDGAAVLFMSSSRGESWDIFILDIQTGAVTPTATHPAEDGLPAWSPDGRAFAFLSNRDGEWGVYTWRLSDHTTTKRFTIGPTLPNWQQAGLDWGP